MKNLTFGGLRGLQKLAQLENVIPSIIRGCFCQKNHCTLFVRGGVTFYTKSGGLLDGCLVEKVHNTNVNQAMLHYIFCYSSFNK